ncbi:hypothetical protein TRSC58_07160 [Trypanosoma rangeli SC58]|uniref:Kinetoplast DNA-associated protein n=1 Tax=Trypanosoma rangeli SC58 TaxID=429131 RepID=A0A061ITC8_TRYRA|nr:hypothetical protein TRSC58_07160 [Trypanosoma rangeli SC58]
MHWRSVPRRCRLRNAPRRPKQPRRVGRNPKRALTKYAQFVKANLPKYSQLPNRERLAAVAKLWKQQQQQQQQQQRQRQQPQKKRV